MHLYERHAHHYKTKSTRGLLKIQNLQSDRILLVPSEQFVHDIQTIRFQLDLGTFDNLVLQKEYETVGLELFVIEPYKEIEDQCIDLQELCKHETSLLTTKNKKVY